MADTDSPWKGCGSDDAAGLLWLWERGYRLEVDGMSLGFHVVWSSRWLDFIWRLGFTVCVCLMKYYAISIFYVVLVLKNMGNVGNLGSRSRVDK